MKNKNRSKEYIILNRNDETYTICNCTDDVVEHLEVMSEDYDNFHGFAEEFIDVYELGRQLKVTVPTQQIAVE